MPQIDIRQYVSDAIRTEKELGEIVTDVPNLKAALRLAVTVGKFVDIVKKGVIYGKPIDSDTLTDAIDQIHDACDAFDKALFRDLPDDYEGEVASVNARLLHSALGKYGEAGEFLEHLLHQLDGKPLDLVGVQEELGDDSWYSAPALDEIGKLTDTSPDTVYQSILDKNIAKLKARYPDKFSLEASEGRDVAVERQILEG
jgi:hypothetical protein